MSPNSSDDTTTQSLRELFMPERPDTPPDLRVEAHPLVPAALGESQDNQVSHEHQGVKFTWRGGEVVLLHTPLAGTSMHQLLDHVLVIDIGGRPLPNEKAVWAAVDAWVLAGGLEKTNLRLASAQAMVQHAR